MDANAAARRWAHTWERAWLAHDADAIATLYADDAVYRSHPFREPETSARDYALRAFAEEDAVECAFSEPMVRGDRAAVEWWAVYASGGKELTLAGVTILRFGADGRVVEHTDYWAGEEGRRASLL